MSQSLPAIVDNLFAGIDVGGTKVNIMDNRSGIVHRYDTPQFLSLDEILEDYFSKIQARPARVVIGMAGARNDETGVVQLTNMDWPPFDPQAASKKYGIVFATANDMVIAGAGVLDETTIDLLQLKPGTSAQKGNKIIITLSTGIGMAGIALDERTNKYVIVASEGGHIGFQPKDTKEEAYLQFLHRKYPHASAELALSGKYGIDNLVDHSLEGNQHLDIAKAIERARKSNRPTGAVLLEYATQGAGEDRQMASDILQCMGSMIGSVIRDLVLVYKATGGVYLIGSVSLGLGEYFAESTDMNKRIVRHGAVHDAWLEKVPVFLVSDPHVAVKGALSLASQ